MRVTGRMRVLVSALAASAVLAACASDSEDGAFTDAAADEVAATDSGDDVGFDRDASSGATASAPAASTASTSGSAGGSTGRLGDGDVDSVVAGAAGAVAQAPDALAGRQLARTARLELRVEDVDQAAARIRAVAARLGGFVAEAEVRGGDDGFGVLTLRLPARSLDTAVEQIGSVAAEVTLQQIGTEDLTSELTDLGTRITNLQALEGELRTLMADVRARSNSADELLTVFNEINGVRLQVERLQAQQAGLADRVALATVTVDLQPVAAPITPVEPEPEAVPTHVQAWEATRAALGAIGDVAIWTALTVVPVGLVLLAPAGLVWLLWRNRRRGQPEATPAG